MTMITRYPHLKHALLLVQVALSLASSSTLSDEDRVDKLMKWVRSEEGGVVNEKVVVQPIFENSSVLGIFAQKEIAVNETIVVIPTSCYIHIMDTANAMDIEKDELVREKYSENVCNLSRKLQHEMNLGQESDFAHYVDYLQQQRRGQLPATWSTEGKNLLRNYLPIDSDVVDWIDLHFSSICKDIDSHYIALTVQRSWDVSLIPLWDMVNHDNGRVNTHTTSFRDPGGIKVWATSTVPAGSQLYSSYDKCQDCLGVSDYWGSTELLRDFGFVERYPRRWVIPEENIWFEVWSHEVTKDLEVRWDDHRIVKGKEHEDEAYYGVPSQSGIAFLRRELTRLHHAENATQGEVCSPSIPSHECQTILQYKNAAIEAISLAISAAESCHSVESM